MTYLVVASFDLDDKWIEKSDIIYKHIDTFEWVEQVGSGAGFGMRDLEFEVDSEDEARDLIDELTIVGHTFYGFTTQYFRNDLDD